jgi:hypothetical protein
MLGPPREIADEIRKELMPSVRVEFRDGAMNHRGCNGLRTQFDYGPVTKTGRLDGMCEVCIDARISPRRRDGQNNHVPTGTMIVCRHDDSRPYVPLLLLDVR